MGRGFQVWKFHLRISPWEEKPCLPWAYIPWEASFSSLGLIFGGEEISIPETRPIRKSYIANTVKTVNDVQGGLKILLVLGRKKVLRGIIIL